MISKLETDLPLYALTIDDCFEPDSLVGVLDLLKQCHLQATFFPVGRAAIICDSRHPEIFKRLAREGHTIGYHTMEHSEKGTVLQTTGGEWNEDYDEWIETFRRLLGRDIFSLAVKRYARAPYGEFTSNFLDMCQNKNLTPYFWSAGSSWLVNDWPLEQGDILLLHATEEILSLMREKIQYVSGDLRGTSITCFDDEAYCSYFYPSEGMLRRRKNFSGYIQGA